MFRFITFAIRFIAVSIILAVGLALTACDYAVGDGVPHLTCSGEEGAGDARREWFDNASIVPGLIRASEFVNREVVIHLVEDQGGSATLILYADSDFWVDCEGELEILGDTQDLFGRDGEYVDVSGTWYEGELDAVDAYVSGDEIHIDK